MQFEMSQEVGSRVGVREASGPLALSSGKPPWCVVPLWGLLPLFSQFSQGSDSGITRLPHIDTALLPHASL